MYLIQADVALELRPLPNEILVLFHGFFLHGYIVLHLLDFFLRLPQSNLIVICLDEGKVR